MDHRVIQYDREAPSILAFHCRFTSSEVYPQRFLLRREAACRENFSLTPHSINALSLNPSSLTLRRTATLNGQRDSQRAARFFFLTHGSGGIGMLFPTKNSANFARDEATC
jgi:hypothetical protein